MKIMRKGTGNLFLLFIVLAIILIGCSNTEGKKSAKNTDEIIKSEQIKLDEDYEEVQDIQKMIDGKIQVGISDKNGKNSRIYETDDKGETWNKKAEITERIQTTDKDFVQFYLGESNEVFIQKVANASSYEETLSKESNYFVIDKDDNLTEIKIPLEKIEETKEEHQSHKHESEHVEINSISYAEFTKDGELLATDYGKNGYLIDAKSGKIKKKYKLLDEFGYAENLSADEKYFYASSPSGFLVYDKATGEMVTDTKLEKVISETLEKASNLPLNIGTSISVDPEGKNIYFSNAMGIYDYDVSSEKVKQHVELNNLEMGLTRDYARLLTMLTDETFLMAVTSSKDQKQSVYLNRLVSGKDAEKQQANTKTLTVWTMKESPDLLRVVDSFKAQYPGVSIEIQIGMDGESAHNISDVISTLNTKMLAKEGPDVLLLDGLPVDTYIQKGMLVDLQPIYDDLMTEKQLFETIASSYKTENGLFAIPQGFSYMAVTAKNDVIDQVKTTEMLLSYLKNGKDLGLGVDSAEMLTSILYYSSIKNWLDGKTVNKVELKKLFEQYKEFHELTDLYEPNKIDFNQNRISSLMSGNFNFFVEKDMKEISVALDYIGAPHLLYGVQTFAQLNFASTIFNEQDGKSFLPTGILGISNSSKNQAIAKDFVKFMLDKDGESMAGIPVNKQLFETGYKETAARLATGTKPLTDEDYQKQLTFINSLDTLVDTNSVISDAVVTQLEAYVLKGESIDTAIENAAKKIELYMSE